MTPAMNSIQDPLPQKNSSFDWKGILSSLGITFDITYTISLALILNGMRITNGAGKATRRLLGCVAPGQPPDCLTQLSHAQYWIGLMRASFARLWVAKICLTVPVRPRITRLSVRAELAE